MKKTFSIFLGIGLMISVFVSNVSADDNSYLNPAITGLSVTPTDTSASAPSTLQGTVPGNPSTIYGSNPNKIPNPLGGNTNSLPAFFNSIVGVAIELGTIISVLAIIYGGFLYVTAQGDEEKLGKAYKTITWALVGTAILLGARTIMLAVTDTVKQLGAGIN